MTGLTCRERPGDPGELARVAHRLEVEADGVGLLVVDPVLHEVVARDVDAVARRGEDRDAEAASRGRGEHCDAEGAALGEEARADRDRGMTEASVALSRTRGVVVDEAEAVGADDRIPARRTRRRSFSCRRTPSSPASAKPAERTSSALTPALPQSLTTLDGLRGRDDDDGEVDGLGHVADARVGLETLDLAAARGGSGRARPGSPPR